MWGESLQIGNPHPTKLGGRGCQIKSWALRLFNIKTWVLFRSHRHKTLFLFNNQTLFCPNTIYCSCSKAKHDICSNTTITVYIHPLCPPPPSSFGSSASERVGKSERKDAFCIVLRFAEFFLFLKIWFLSVYTTKSLLMVVVKWC